MLIVSQHQLEVAVLGPRGTYTHEAAYEIFGNIVEYEELRTISDILSAVQESVQIGVVPQENTIYGNVTETYDCLRHLKCGFVKGEVTLQIQHCLLVLKGMKLEDVDTVLSHEQALGQCQEFLDANLPNATLVKTPSTASAAQKLINSHRNCAAICSKVCAKIFCELEILREGIQSMSNNFTRFYVVVRDREVQLPIAALRRTEGRALIRLRAPGTQSLKDMIRCLTTSDLNIVRIDRRPSGVLPFRDVYFVELASTPESIEFLGQSQAIRLWSAAVSSAIHPIRSMEGEVDLIGLW